MHTAIPMPIAFSIFNLQSFVNDLLISLSIARVTLVYENKTSEIATTVLACKESANIKWYTLNTDRPYMEDAYFFGWRGHQDRHLVFLAFNSGSWLYLMEIQWILESYKWGWQGSSQYLFLTDNEDAEDQEILEQLRHFRKYNIYTALLRYTRSGVVEIFKLPDTGQLQRLVYTNDIDRSVADSLHHFLFKKDQFLDLNGTRFPINANLYVPNLFYANLGDWRDNETTLGGSFVHLATMIERYLNVTVQFKIMDYMDLTNFNKAIEKYTIEEVLKVRKADEVLPSTTNMSITPVMDFTISEGYRLYPHKYIEYVIIVPSDIKEQSGIGDMLLKSPLFTVWAIIVGIITLTRMIVRKVLAFNNNFDERNSNQNAIIYIVFNTFGLSFGATSVTGAQSRTEKVIVLFLSFFCMVAGILCTGFLLEQVMGVKSEQKINSLEQILLEKDLKVAVPHELYHMAADYKVFPTELEQQKISPTYVEYMAYFLSIETPLAYVVPKEVAKSLLVTDKQHFYHVIPKRYGSFQLSFIVYVDVYQHRLNVIFQRLVEQGLLDYFERRVLCNLGVKDEKFSSSSGQNLSITSVTFSELRFMLILMLIGLFTSIFIFILEIFVSRQKKEYYARLARLREQYKKESYSNTKII